MKRILLICITSILTSVAALSQCTPDPLYADSLYGVWPDTVINFAPGVINVAYFQQLDIAVPSNASQVPNQGLPPFAIDSGAVLNVSGLPPGLSYACNSHTPAFCTFLGGGHGCAILEGTPTELGVFEITIDLEAYIFGFAYPLSFDGYRVVVTDGSVGLEELNKKPDLAQNVPNPFNQQTVIPFSLKKAEVVDFKVMDLLGQEVFSQKIDAMSGSNKFTFRAEGLESGIYLYSIESSAGTITRRMVLDRRR